MSRSVHELWTRFASSALLAALPAHAASPSPPTSWAEGGFDGGEARVEARLLVHPERPADGRVRAGVLFSLDPGWRLYWKNPGESGLPTRLDWRGGEAGPLSWPAPTAFEEGEQALVSYGYEGHVLLASELRIDPVARSIGAEADLLACRSSCTPVRLSLERSLDAVDSGEAAGAVRRLFELHDESLPLRPEALGVTLEASLADAARPTEISLAVLPCDEPAPDQACAALAAPPGGPVFIPERAGLRVRDVAAHPKREGGLLVRLEQATGVPGRVQGLLALRGADGRVHNVEVDLSPSVPARPAGLGRLPATLAFGLVGGLLLNLIPCVLGMLGLKTRAVAELEGRNRRAALAQAGAYAAGVLATTLALAGAVWALCAAASRQGWQIELDSPELAVGVSGLLVLFALNLLGVFEFGFLPRALAGVGAGGSRRSFFEGLLAVAFAAPSAAPLVGLVIGFAPASGGLWRMASVAAIGCGLAAPFVLISAFPRSASWLPRPGPWMADLESVLGFVLLATVVWLVSWLGHSAGAAAAAALLALLLVIAIVAWGYGRLERRELRLALVATGALVLLAGPNLIAVDAPSPAGAAQPGRASVERWQPAAVERYLAEGRPVFVSFTADWCLTCQLDERSVLSQPRVRAALERGRFALLRADWTRRDETIRRELARFDRAGVPLYVVHQPGAGAPHVLPEPLTAAALLVALGSDLAALEPAGGGEAGPLSP